MSGAILTDGLRARNRVQETSLAGLTTMRVGGAATVVALEAVEDLPELRDAACRFLGKGANIVAGDAPFAEPIVRLGRSFAELRIEPGESGHLRVTAGAAVDLALLVKRCCAAGGVGPAALAGVPASVGGALTMNAGTARAWIGDLLVRVQVVLPEATQPCWIDRETYGPHYRGNGLPAGTVFLACELALEQGDASAEQERARALKRAKAAVQPLAAHSAGCVFTNPGPDLSAGCLLDELGCKGWRVGGAAVSLLHANFIVNDGSATAADVFRLIARLRRHAWRERGVVLTTEVKTWQADASLLVHPEALPND